MIRQVLDDLWPALKLQGFLSGQPLTDARESQIEELGGNYAWIRGGTDKLEGVAQDNADLVTQLGRLAVVRAGQRIGEQGGSHARTARLMLLMRSLMGVMGYVSHTSKQDVWDEGTSRALIDKREAHNLALDILPIPFNAIPSATFPFKTVRWQWVFRDPSGDDPNKAVHVFNKACYQSGHSPIELVFWGEKIPGSDDGNGQADYGWVYNPGDGRDDVKHSNANSSANSVAFTGARVNPFVGEGEGQRPPGCQ